MTLSQWTNARCPLENKKSDYPISGYHNLDRGENLKARYTFIKIEDVLKNISFGHVFIKDSIFWNSERDLSLSVTLSWGR